MGSTQIWSAQHIRDFAQRKWRALSAELNIRQDGTPLRTVAHEMDRKILNRNSSRRSAPRPSMMSVANQGTDMQNQAAAVNRRLSDPDFQGWIVRNCMLLVVILTTLLCVFVVHDAYVWTHPPKPVYFFVDGHNQPTPAVPLDSPIVDDTELLEWSAKWVLAPYNVNYHDFPPPAAAERRRAALHR